MWNNIKVRKIGVLSSVRRKRYVLEAALGLLGTEITGFQATKSVGWGVVFLLEG